MTPVFTVVVLLMIWWCFYYIALLGSLDPHNIEATPASWITILRSGVTLVALLIILGTPDPNWRVFFSMFVLSQTVAVAFKWPDRYRKDEVPSCIKRYILANRSSTTGAIAAKVLSIALAFLTSWLIKDWWFVLLMSLGFMLITGKGYAALLDLQPQTSSGNSSQSKQHLLLLKKWKVIVFKGQVAYALGCAVFGWTLFEYANLEPGNWMGWAGLLGGAAIDAVFYSDTI